MGWCSGTLIMDAAVSAADALAARFREFEDEHQCCPPVPTGELDNLLRPFVRTIARKLHDGDWDCVDEADAFDRFPQEMHDFDDVEYERWLVENIAEQEPEHRAKYVTWLAELQERMDHS